MKALNRCLLNKLKKNFRQSKMVLAVSIFAALCILANAVDAATISVTSYRGGNRINFGNVDANSSVSRELRVSVTGSNDSYQVRQLITQPLTSKRGKRLKDNVLSFYTIRGSNARGTLYKTDKQTLAFKDEILYVSDSQGTSDNFKLGYLFEGKKLTTPEHFYGQIAYVVETKSGQSQRVVFDIEFNARLDLKLEVKVRERPLKLSTKSEHDLSTYADFSISATAGRKLNIYQMAQNFPANYKGTSLPKDALKFYISESQKGQGQYTNPTAVERGDLLIYTSEEGADSFRINFLIERQKLLEAEQGIYRGKLIYRLQQEGAEKVTPLDIEVEVAKIFDMKVTSEGLTFRNLKPGAPAEEKIVQIDVQSNLQAPYQVNQMIKQALTNPEGQTIADNYFSMRQELLAGEGDLFFNQFAPVEVGERAIFHSDNKGGDASLRIIYRLTPAMDILAGTYSTSVTYSLSER